MIPANHVADVSTFHDRPQTHAPMTVGPTALRMSCLRGSGRLARPQKKHSDVRNRRDSSGVPNVYT